MKILTLTQPWATLVAIGAKRIETRSWSTSYRGPLAIHAGAGLGPVRGKTGLRRLCRDNELFYRVLRNHITDIFGSPIEPAEALPRGVIVAVVELPYCVPTVTVRNGAHPGFGKPDSKWPLTDQEQAFGNYELGRYAWLLDNVRPLRKPLPYRGAQGLRDLDDAAADEVMQRTA